MFVPTTIARPSGTTTTTNAVLVLRAEDDLDCLHLLNVQARPGAATEMVMATCNFLSRLLRASEKRHVYIHGSFNRFNVLPVSGPT